MSQSVYKRELSRVENKYMDEILQPWDMKTQPNNLSEETEIK